MIFVGDVAVPPGHEPAFPDLPSSFENSRLVVNFEGDSVSDGRAHLSDRVLFSDPAVGPLLRRQNVAVATLANNHVLDVRDRISPTAEFLSRNGVTSCGAGDDLSSASTPAEIAVDGRAWLFLAYGWKPIRCRVASRRAPGVNPLRADHVLDSVSRTRRRRPDATIVVLPHWNYELEAFPQPAHRQLARRAIDAGADAVVGSHPHRVGGIEIHGGAPIVYSLGNWYLPQGVFYDGRLRYPSCAQRQLAFEWHPTGSSATCHWFRYRPSDHVVRHVLSEPLHRSATIGELTPYGGMDHESYVRWFRRRRLRRKGLPVYEDCDARLGNSIRDWIVRGRDLVVQARNLVTSR